MKKIALPLLLAIITIVMSCKEDFKVSAPYKDITVVYSILDMADTAHYLRIEKAFLDESKSAIDMATVPDSSFYSSLDVKVIELDVDLKAIKSLPLTKVDLNDEGYSKQSGSFFNNRNYAFKFKYTLNPYDYYQFVITNTATGRVDSSMPVTIVNNDPTTGQGHFYIADFSRLTTPYTINFAKTISAANKVQLNGNVPWKGVMFEGHIIFHYVDSNVISGLQTDHAVDYTFGTTVPGGGANYFTLEVLNSSIYNFMKDAIGAAPDNTLRLLDSCDVTVYAGNQDLYTYQQVTLGQANGLTGDQIRPNFTNMMGANALGLIASRTSRTYKKAAIDDATMTSIIDTPFLRDLKIVGRSSH